VVRWGYPAGFEKRLGAIKFIGALGLLALWFTRPLGDVAAGAFVVYFLLALRTHAKAKDDVAQFVPAAVLLGLAIATFVVAVSA
jgi:hypothetical protein